MLIDAAVNQRWYPALPHEAMEAYAIRGEQPYSDTPQLKDYLRDAVAFSLHNIAHHFYEDHSERKWEMEDFPRPVPPFKVAWFEWSAPRFLLDHCQFERMGCLVFQIPAMSQGVTWGSLPLIQRRGGDIGTWPVYMWATAADGSLCLIEGVDPEAKIKNRAHLFVGQHYEKLAAEHKDKLSFISEQVTQPVLFSLSLLHCKNVVQRDAVQSKPLIKARATRGLWSRSAFKIIEIRPMGGKAKPTGQPGPGHRPTIRRGHFKNYKEGAGLFGKLHGLYWWDQFIEGDAAAAAYKFNKSMVPSLEVVE